MNNIIGKKRFWFMGISMIALFIISFIHITATGNSYDIHTRFFYGHDANFTTSIEYSESGVVECTGDRMDDEEIVVSLKSVSKGSTDIRFKVISDSGNEAIFRTTVYVNGLGTIFEDTEYIFNFSGYRVVVLQIIIGICIVMGTMVFTFLEMRKKAKYGYSMIAAGGVALFCAILIAFIVYKSMNNVVTSFSVFITLITETGKQFLLAMSPFMIVLAISLSVSNIWLLRNEGYRPVNALGIAFSIVWVIGMAISFGFFFNRIDFIRSFPFADSLNKAFIYLCCYFECMLISTIICSYSASRHLPPYDRDCIIILGCAIRSDGTPTPLLRMRTQSAIDFEKEQFSRTGKHALFVPSGGQGSDEIICEAESMKRYMIGQGVPEEQIAPEGKSTSTEENMRFSKAVIEERLGDITKKNIAFATTNYHVFRGYVLAKKNGFEAQGISAKTKWYFFPNAFLREFVGLLYERKVRHIIQIIAFIAVFVGLGSL